MAMWPLDQKAVQPFHTNVLNFFSFRKQDKVDLGWQIFCRQRAPIYFLQDNRNSFSSVYVNQISCTVCAQTIINAFVSGTYSSILICQHIVYTG
ncbi:hypothetical protein GDO78_005237 [Eleutherodactylus coqui]|uniref:Uncharacterized protein n=1 Tax=Eleutherodactylus coqui TaxID=57060 RepID=A0A8J6FJV9_ELECQ|nr:hypothetical protein GDO78_005237 [Eleutherodactylus coqui]